MSDYSSDYPKNCESTNNVGGNKPPAGKPAVLGFKVKPEHAYLGHFRQERYLRDGHNTRGPVTSLTDPTLVVDPAVAPVAPLRPRAAKPLYLHQDVAGSPAGALNFYGTPQVTPPLPAPPPLPGGMMDTRPTPASSRPTNTTPGLLANVSGRAARQAFRTARRAARRGVYQA